MRGLLRIPLTISIVAVTASGVSADARRAVLVQNPAPPVVAPTPGLGEADLPQPHSFPPPAGTILPPAGVPLFPGPAMIPVAPAPLTLTCFARDFRPDPTGGPYEVVLVHPVTGCPVKVCFNLPCGCPRAIRVVFFGRWLTFDYGKSLVRIRFTGDGGYKVAYK